MLENLRVGGGMAASSMQPAVMIIVVVASLLIFLLPRKYAIAPFLLAIFFTAFGQQLYIAGTHVYVFRILILCGWIRIFLDRISSKTGIASGGFSRIDRVFLWWASIRAFATVLEFGDKQAVVNQVGFLVDSLGGYFFLRYLIRNETDVVRVVKVLAVITAVLAVTMTAEIVLGWNAFSRMAASTIVSIRDGQIRARGSLVGPIQAGSFAAALVCLMVWLCRNRRSRFLGIVGLGGALVMIATSRSSTPLMAVLAGLGALACWPIRAHMWKVRWGLVAMLVSLHMVMKAPVWMLINHINLVGGNSSYHRAMLVDQFIRHFGDWWMIGVKTTGEWGWDMWDQANQFVTEGESGGLLTFICFLMLVSWVFGRIGTARKLVRGRSGEEWLFWCLGSTMFAYVVSFFGISFSDQTVYGWYAFLAMAGAATSSVFARGDAPQRREAAPSPADIAQVAG